MSALLFGAVCFSNTARAEDISLLPLYGGQPKSSAQIELDETFRRDALHAAGTAEKAAAILVAKGFDAVAAKDADTAVRRFNEAWLLKPDKADIFWGLAAAQSLRGKDGESLTLFARARALDPKNAELLTDLGFAEMRFAAHSANSRDDAQKHLLAATAVLGEAAAADPRYELAYTNWALALATLGRPQEAWEKVFRAESLGGSSLDKRFLADLDGMLPRQTAQGRAALRTSRPPSE